MAYSTIDKGSSFANTALYTGNSSTQAITGLGFQPDLVWIKRRDGTYNHYWFDAPRGVGYYIKCNQDAAQADGNPDHLTAFDSDGFTLGSTDGVNATGDTFASWSWKAGTTSGLSGGTITPAAYSINTTSKFGIYKYTGNGTAGATIAHGLGATPYLVIVKRLTNTYDWAVQNPYTHATDPQEYILRLNTTNYGTQDDAFNNTLATSTVVTLGASTYTNATSADQEYVMYAWAPLKGYSKFSLYKGNASANGPVIYTGFKPEFILVKRWDSGSINWILADNKREGYNPDNDPLYPDVTVAEGTADNINIYSNGFKVINSGDDYNNDGGKYFYAAFGQPIVASNGVVTTAR